MNIFRFLHKDLLAICLFFLSSNLGGLQAQGWLRHYPATGGFLTGAADPTALVLADNGDFIFGGGSGFVPTQSAEFLFLVRIDPDGNPVWVKRHEIPAWTLSFLEKCPGGGLIAGGNSRVNGADRQMLLKVSEAGDSLWAVYPNPDITGYLNCAIASPDGMLLVNGTAQNPQLGAGERIPVLYKINPQDGSIIWTRWYPGHGQNENGCALLAAPGNRLIQCSIGTDTTFIRHLDADGVLQFTIKIPVTAGSTPILGKPEADGYSFMVREHTSDVWFRRYDYDGNLLESNITPNLIIWAPTGAEHSGGFTFASIHVTPDIHYTPLILFMDLHGNFSDPVYPMEDFSTGLDYPAHCIAPTPDGGYLIVGPNGGQATWFALKTDSLGHIDYGQIAGNAFKDKNLDCVPGPDENGLHTIRVQATDLDFGAKLYETIDQAGEYLFKVPAGNYSVELLDPGYAPDYWEPCPPMIASIGIQGDSMRLDSMGLKPVIDCPFMKLDIGAGLFRPCLPVALDIQVFNAGTLSADSAIVFLELDPLLTYDSSSLAPVALAGQQLWFKLENLEELGTASFRIWATVNCDAMLGQVLCVDGHVWPDSICNTGSLAWDGSDLKVRAYCDGDSVRFQVLNLGTGDMSEARQLLIIEDYIILRSIPLQLPAGADTLFSEPNPDGQSYYARIRQTEGYFGYPVAADGVEICDGQGLTGMLLQFPLFSGGLFDDRYCEEVRTAFDPNDKRGFPLGYGAQHFIDRGLPIEYMIRFQNTGNDTAFLVLLRDSLPSTLDVSTLSMGSSSHPYTWELNGQNVLSCRFANIRLPDSTTNEAASHGFVKFSILPRADLASGTRVENRAAIYFDFNAPVFTPFSEHTVDSNFIQVGVHTPTSQPMVRVWPNPAEDQVLLEIPAGTVYPCQLKLHDTYGRLIRQEKITGSRHSLSRRSLPAGVYILELEDARGKIVAGKVVWGR